LGLDASTRLLDVATGTGLVIEAALSLGGSAENLIGLDPSPGMLSAHGSLGTVGLVRGRGEQLPFPENRFDLVTMGYALRHVADLKTLFQEFRRVLQPGGRVLVLEITRPDSRILQRCLRFYFARVVPLLLGRRRRQRSAQLMDYYWSTIEACVPPVMVTRALADSGFTDVQANATGPVLTDYLAIKP
jgi:demethylmenaquinone methyltransferase/2-methoxy-6-polyprenyl-1,4-benzoquinol methylase